MAKTPIEIKSLARSHTKTALNVLASIMNEPSAPHSARVSAATALLDRGWGKPSQTISGDPDNPLVTIKRIERVIVPMIADQREDRPTEH
jgi:hypothetical protein